MISKAIDSKAIEYLKKFIIVPDVNRKLTEDEWFDLQDQVMDLCTQHVMNQDSDANYLNDIADKLNLYY